MEKRQICEKLERVMRRITIQTQRKLYCGSGVVIREDGLVLTAAHVVAENCRDPYHGAIMVNEKARKADEYAMLISQPLAIDIGLPDYMGNVPIDLMLLAPKQTKSDVEYIELEDQLAKVGDDVIIGGFPEDIGYPLEFFDYINFDNPEMKKHKVDVEKFKQLDFRQPVQKSAMVGLVNGVDLQDCDVSSFGFDGLERVTAHGADYWLDNQLTYGGSGGPMVNMDGKLVGIMYKKEFTNQENDGLQDILVPSGTGRAISHKLITWMLSHIKL